MNDYFEAWYQVLMSASSLEIKGKAEAWGECHIVTGPRIMYAKVNIAIQPGEALKISFDLNRDKLALLKEYGWDSQIVFGVLDIMMVSGPYRQFELSIRDVDIHKVHSVATAFRIAARNATKTILADLTSE